MPDSTACPLPLRYRRLDGETINAEAAGVRINFQGSRAVLYVLRDVTRWLLAEQVLRESQAMYRDVVESVNEVLFQADAEGRITFLNRAWRNTTGFDTRLSIGQNLLDFVIEDDRGRVGHCLSAIREGYQDIGQFEFRLRTQATSPRWVEATIRPLRNAYDHVVGSSGTLDDITVRKEAEQTQRNLNRSLRPASACAPPSWKPPTGNSKPSLFGLPRPARPCAPSTALRRSSRKTTPRASTKPAANTSSASASPPSAWPASSTT
jgi:PAS domain S-box-containing protein